MSSANTTYMILCTALVCLMTPGLAFFYGGLTRKKNVFDDAFFYRDGNCYFDLEFWRL